MITEPRIADAGPRAGTRAGRRALILELLLYAALVLAVGQLVLLADYGAWGRVVAGAAALVGVLGCRLAVARAESPITHRAATMVMMVCAAALPFVLDSAASWPALLITFLYFVPAWGVRSGVIVVGAMCVGQFVLMTGLGISVARASVESLSSAVILGCALGTAWLVADHDRQRREITELLADREQSFERESELMLIQERTRAARDLHDGLGHRLTLVSMALQFARDARRLQPDRAWEQVDHAQDQARQALDHIRRWVRALTPPDEPAAPAGEPLAQIAVAFREAGMEIDLEASGAEAPTGSQLRLYERRFVQEGLTNALRYAPGGPVRVSRTVIDDRLRIQVSNEPADRSSDADGTGNRHGEVNEGFGLRSLRERAEALGGCFAAERSGGGFSITAELPLTPGADRALPTAVVQAAR